MARVTVKLPSMLTLFTDGRDSLELCAESLAEALAALKREHPALAQQLIDESGRLREHVLCFHNDVNTRWSASPNAALKDGDVLTILQAVSGG